MVTLDNAPTPERRRRSVFIEGPAPATDAGPARAGLRIHRALTTLERLLKAGNLEPHQVDAGERFRADGELGVLGARETTSGSASTTGWYYSEARLAALQRWHDAYDVLGPTDTVVCAIVFHDLSISDLANRLQQNRQAIAGILKLGLTALAQHYGIDCDRTKIRHNMLTSGNRRVKHSGNRP